MCRKMAFYLKIHVGFLFGCWFNIIVLNLFGNAFFYKPFMNGFSDKRIDNGEDRHTKEHTENAKQTAHENNSDHDPYTADTDAISENGRCYNVTVDLLNDQDDNGEDDSRLKSTVRGDQNDGNTRYGTEERTEYGNKIGNANQQGDHGIIGNTEDPGEKIYDQHNNGGIDDLSTDKLTEFRIYRFNKMRECHVVTEREERQEETLDLLDKKFFGCQKVNREDKTQKEICHGGDKGKHVVCRKLDHGADVALQTIKNTLQIYIGNECFIELGKRIVVVDCILEIDRNVVNQSHRLCEQIVETLDKLRNQNEKKSSDKSQENKVCENDTYRTARFLADAVRGDNIQNPFTATKERIQKIGNDDAEEDGADDGVKKAVPYTHKARFVRHKADTKNRK